MRAGTHNSASVAKIGIRQSVMDVISNPRVLECFAGPVGEMHKAVWHAAEFYEGIDRDLDWRNDQRRRYCGDTSKIVRSIDLQRFNVFDIDAFGSPWEIATIVFSNRKWEPGEMGAVILTDGSSMKQRFGELPHALAALLGCGTKCQATENSEEFFLAGAASLLRIADLKHVQAWHATGKGSSKMNYGAFVFVAN